MTTTIALAGKGGVGKTTISGMVIKYLVQNQPGAILAIDADPSSNLNMVLGLELEWTVGEIREDLLSQVKETLTAGGAAMGALPGGVSKREYLDYQVRSSVSPGSAAKQQADAATEPWSTGVKHLSMWRRGAASASVRCRQQTRT